jgi:hypothetical protein
VAAADRESPSDAEIQVDAAQAQLFRDWLNRSALRHAQGWPLEQGTSVRAGYAIQSSLRLDAS